MDTVAAALFTYRLFMLIWQGLGRTTDLSAEELAHPQFNITVHRQATNQPLLHHCED